MEKIIEIVSWFSEWNSQYFDCFSSQVVVRFKILRYLVNFFLMEKVKELLEPLNFFSVLQNVSILKVSKG